MKLLPRMFYSTRAHRRFVYNQKYFVNVHMTAEGAKYADA